MSATPSPGLEKDGRTPLRFATVAVAAPGGLRVRLEECGTSGGSSLDGSQENLERCPGTSGAGLTGNYLLH